MRKTTALWATMAVFGCSGEPDQKSAEPDAVILDMSTDTLSEPDTTEDLPVSPVLTWSKSKVADTAIVEITGDNGVVWALSDGEVHRFQADAQHKFDIAELSHAVDIDAHAGRVSAVGMSAENTPYLAQFVGANWLVSEIVGHLCPPPESECAFEPGGVNVATDLRTRITGRYQFMTRQADGFAPEGFAGSEDARFNDARWMDDSAVWMFGKDMTLHRDASGKWWRRQGTEVGSAATGSIAFMQSEQELLRLDTNGQTAKVPTAKTFRDVDQLNESIAVFAGDDAQIAVLAPAINFGEPMRVNELFVNTTDDFTAVHIVSNDEVWLGTNEGVVYRFGLGVRDGWETVDGDDVDLTSYLDVPDPDPDPDPNPDPDPEPEPEPPSTFLRFVGFDLGNYVCAGTTAVTGVLGEFGVPSSGYTQIFPGTYSYYQEPSAAGRCRGFNVGRFDVRIADGEARTAVVGLSGFSATVLLDDISAPSPGTAKVRFFGRDRIGTSDLTDVVYCIDGVEIEGGSKPSGKYLSFPPGAVDVDVRIDTCAGELRDIFSVDVEAGRVYSLFLSASSKPGPVRELDDVNIIKCTDSVDGVIQVPSPCRATWSTPVLP